MPSKPSSPNLLIFRVPSEHGQMEDGALPPVLLVEVNITEDGLEQTGRLFTPGAGSTYDTLRFNEFVLANRVEGGSIDVAWFHTKDQVYELGQELADIIDEAAASLQPSSHHVH